MQKIHVHNDFDVQLNFTNIKTDYVSKVEFWTRKDDIYCCCRCDGSLKVEDDSNIVCYLNDHNLGTGKLNYNVVFQIPDPNYADGYKKVCQHYVSDIFLTSENGDTTVAIVKVIGGEEATNLINRLSEFEKVFDNKQDKLQFDNTPTIGSKNVVYSDGIYNAIKNNKPDLSDYAKKSDLQGLASEQWVTDKGYLTEHQSLADYAKKTDLQGLASENWVTNQGYLTEHQSLADYAKKTDLQGLASENWVTNQGYITSIPSNYITESELNSKGYVPEKFDSDNYNSHIDVKNASIFLDSQKWMKYVKIDPQSIKVYDKGIQGQEIYTQLTTNTIGVVKSKDGKTDLAAFLITDEGKGSLRVKDSENELNISTSGITIKEGIYEHNIDIKDIATMHWVNECLTDRGYITSIPDYYVTETELASKGYLTEHQSLADYAKKSDIPSVEGLATEQWVTNQGYITSIPSDYITETELNNKGYLTEHQSLADYAKKTDLQGLASENWVTNQGYITSIPSDYITESELNNKGYLTEHQSLADYAKKSDIPSNTSIETVTPAADTEYTLNSNQYLRIIPAAAVKLTFNKSDGTGLMREYHILIDCTTAVPTTEFNGVLWDLANDIVFEKGKMYDIVIRDDGTNLYGSWKAYKLMDITISITTSDATAVRLNGTTYNLVAGDNSLTDIGLKTITDIVGFNDTTQREKFTSIDFGGATIKIEKMLLMFQGMSNLTKISNITIKGAVNFTSMFAGDTSLKEIDVANWDTSSALYFGSMFKNCSSLTSLDTSKWNTSSATNFRWVFQNCSSLTSLDTSKWDTSSATNFRFMFNGCASLNSLDVSGWNTSRVTDFGGMFDGCSSLTSLDTSNWDTSSATNFRWAFQNCGSLNLLDVSGWNTSNVTDFGYMFYGCSNLAELSIFGWDTISATNLSCMFYGCSNLAELEVDNWDTSNVTDYSGMFYGCLKLAELNLSPWTTFNASNFSGMFNGCRFLKTLDVSSFEVGKVTDFSGMFCNCRSLTALNVENWNVRSATDFSYMFCNCGSLTSLDVYGWDVSSATNFNHMFCACSGLTDLDLSNWNVSNVTDFGDMFCGCTNLQTLDISGWNTSSATNFSNMFYDCDGLTSLDLSNFDTSNVTNFYDMFAYSDGLTSLNLSGWNTSSATNFSGMFDNCTNLQTLDISGWNISESADITNMLRKCNALTTIRMVGCSQDTINKITSVKPASATIITN